MATLRVPPSPQPPSNMAHHRVPLTTLANGPNSPFRSNAITNVKRSRTQTTVTLDGSLDNQPPQKKQAIAYGENESRRPAVLRKGTYQSVTKAADALNETKPTKQVDKGSKREQDNMESIRQWKRHYRKVFPQIVFFFEGIPKDVHARISRQILTLGAREEIFFSNKVTHVVTTRDIPPESSTSNTGSAHSEARLHEQTKTINPSLLETQSRNKFSFESALARRQASAAGVTTRLENGIVRKQVDVLHKAREMGMKIWALEKLDRMLSTLFNTDTEDAPLPQTRTQSATAKSRDGLAQMLHRETQQATNNVDWACDMVNFRGYYLYVHDMDEQTRPAMIREYSRAAQKEQGKWPQLRVTSPGRCPFLDEPRSRVLENQAAEKAREEAKTIASRTRAASAALQAHRPLAENNNLATRRATSTQESFAQPKPGPIQRTSTDTLPPFGSMPVNTRVVSRYGGEPTASGMQPSNITSAIRSQMISSTAPGMGHKAASKEMNQLKRKVLERNSSATTTSFLADARAGLGDDAGASRPSKRKAEALEGIAEEEVIDVANEVRPKRRVVTRKRKQDKEAKPGYCENCRAKFDDFEEHIASRNHRKFALAQENWRELDSLLEQLVRPLRDE
ncbi:hypothetical protein EJ06DRAFT_87248 [Trichodelitschia bisporula]|uniref:DBF4-type domain-containing protein n=1 Tax=Trichodelitschia bisporula TaxID=703511 RepID=A0A6G1HRH4_9PEZI|nr:hypothetical protein EJ06DRAFT_87248 [Trichodelitschia bisporula]